jgi:hypothetical protein
MKHADDVIVIVITQELDSLMDNEEPTPAQSDAATAHLLRRSSALEAALANAGVLLDKADIDPRTDWLSMTDPIVDSLYAGEPASRSKLMSVFGSADSGVGSTPAEYGRSPASVSSAGSALPSPAASLGLPLPPPPGFGFGDASRAGSSGAARAVGSAADGFMERRDWPDVGLGPGFSSAGVSYGAAGAHGSQRYVCVWGGGVSQSFVYFANSRVLVKFGELLEMQ